VVAFRIVQPIGAPPEYVVGWWLDYTSTDVQLTPGIVRRDVERLDDQRTYLRTTSVVGGRDRTTDGVVTRTGPVSWQMEGQVTSRDRIVSSMRSKYLVEPEVAGSRVIADFEFVGRTLSWRFAIWFSAPALRRRQRESFHDYADAIERDYAARGNAPPTGTAPPVA
jgi:hypothetical protein